MNFYMPDLFNFNWAVLSEWASVLQDMPSFNELPPAAMLKGSTVYSTWCILLALMKPLVSVFSYVFSLAGFLEKNKILGNVAAGNAGINGILTNLTGNERITALEIKNMACVTNEDGQITELSVHHRGFKDSISIVFNLKWLAACSCLVKVDLECGKNVTGA